MPIVFIPNIGSSHKDSLQSSDKSSELQLNTCIMCDYRALPDRSTLLFVLPICILVGGSASQLLFA